MKIYQPLCPDITFRLVADLSPETVDESEESTPSSRSAASTPENEEINLNVYEETEPNSHHSHHLHNTSYPSCSASPVCAIRIKDAFMPDYVSDGATPFPSSTSLPQLPSQSAASVSVCTERRSVHITHVGRMDTSHPKVDCNETCTVANGTDDEACPEQSSTCHGGVFQDDKTNPTAFNAKEDIDDDDEIINASDKCYSHSPDEQDHDHPHRNDRLPTFQSNDSRPTTDDDDDDDDDDDISIEDVSISRNVPMCPPSPETLSSHCCPTVTQRAENTRAFFGTFGSQSTCGSSRGRRPSVLTLTVPTKSVTKYSGPYTLACDITPSPMLEQTTMNETLLPENTNSNHPANASVASSPGHGSNHPREHSQPAKSPDSPQKHQSPESPSSSMVRSIYDEIQEALIKEASDDVLEAPPPSQVDASQQYPFIYKHMGHLFDKKRLLIGYTTTKISSAASKSRDSSISTCDGRKTSSYTSRNISVYNVASEVGAVAADKEVHVGLLKLEDLPAGHAEEEASMTKVGDRLHCDDSSASVMYGQKRRRKNSDGDGSRRHSSSTMSTPYRDLEVTHRGMHRFIPRHADEVQIGIGDPIHVIKEFDDLWCEGVNLRSGERGIFPAMYANDLTFLEESDEEDEHWKFTMRFLGTVEVTSSSGDFALCQAINKVAQQGRIKTASLCVLEINQYGIRMIDKSKEGHESEKFTNFFALKNISFCGTHPNNNRYFAFITKHPRQLRFACHVFHSERSTHRARDALGHAFRRFYQEYMAFTHPTEDIWIE